MGQKLIITEEEKNNIRNLYEVKPTEQFSTPPPNESIFVIKKNPYKDSEYITARQTYKGNLQNGLLFYILDTEKVKEWFLGILNNNLFNKSVRIFKDEDDKIINIPKLIYMTISPHSVRPDGNFTYGAEGNIPGHTYNVNVYYDGIIREDYARDKYSSPKTYSSQKIDNIQKLFIDYGLWSKIPDDFFSIHKIQREKTDF